MDKNYSKEEIWEIENRTRIISSDPYKLYIAFALSSILDSVNDEDEPKESAIGITIPRKTAELIVSDCIMDFTSAIDNGCMIDIGNKRFSIRNRKRCKKDLLPGIFKFEDSDEVTITNKCIFIPDWPEVCFKKEEPADSMKYFQKIVYLSDSTDDGYDKLTDIEAAVYCWGLFHSKHSNSPTGAYLYSAFYDKYKNNFDVDFYELMECVRDGQKFPFEYWSFPVDKIKDWNKKHNQESVIDSVNENAAADYWYDVALKKRFLEKG